MSPRNTILRLVGVLCGLVFATTALADPGNGNGDGNAYAYGTGNVPPGQEKKADPQVGAAQLPDQAAAPAQAQQAERQARQAAREAAKPKPKPKEKSDAKVKAKGHPKADKPAERTRPTPPAEELRGRSAEAHHHVIVCHRTGSESNPYVVINIPLTAWTSAHSPDTGSHPDLNGRHDILLKDPASAPGAKDGFTKEDCEARAEVTAAATPAAAAQPTNGCPPATTEQPALLGVWHATGAFRNGERKYVFIEPNEGSAHYSKHEDDIPVYETRSVVVTTPSDECAPPPAQNAAPTSTTGQAQEPEATQVAGMSAPGGRKQAEVRETRLAGAVEPRKGKSAPKAEPKWGVLGAVASAPASLARTVANETLPFTGIPLWIAALLGAAIVLSGFALRRAT